LRKLDVISDNEPRPKPAQHPLSAERRRLPRTDKARRAVAEGSTQAAERNRRTQDILHNEQAQRLISGAAYRVGREIEQSLEKAAVGGAVSTWRDPDCIRSAADHEGRALRSVDAGLKLRQHWARIQGVVGTIDTSILHKVLADRLSYSEVAAALTGKASERDGNYYARRFRDALEFLAKQGASAKAA
jgi:hypothetical protein